jgi:hypothetical protein
MLQVALSGPALNWRLHVYKNNEQPRSMSLRYPGFGEAKLDKLAAPAWIQRSPYYPMLLFTAFYHVMLLFTAFYHIMLLFTAFYRVTGAPNYKMFCFF